jgi:hypothetical protein
MQFVGNNLVLGGYIRGFIPVALQTTNNNDEFAENRFQLRNAWNTNYLAAAATKTFPCTPFRAINNSGDLLSRQQYSCGGSCQTPQSVPNVYGLKNHSGHIRNSCDATGIQPSSCNVKYVTDFSEYVRFQKLRAVNKNYNDFTYGGDIGWTNQSAIRAIRRY